MAWINGLERKRFNEEQKRLAEQYHKYHKCNKENYTVSYSYR